MLFDPEAIANKTRHIDALRGHEPLVTAVAERAMRATVRLTHLPRVSEPGGGSTLYRLDADDGTAYLLKVKHRSVWVESRLEAESAFLRVPSLANEQSMLTRLAGLGWVPRVRFFAEQDGWQFLALELLTPLPAVAANLSVDTLLDLWRQLDDAARELYRRGLVHTDLHEHNLCVRGTGLVIVDFEEARELTQDLPFEESLDAVGRNRYGDVGHFPEVIGAESGLTSLARLERVFRRWVSARLPDLVERCHFDRNHPFNLDPLQESDPRVYQSIRVAGFAIEGQRPARDPRRSVIKLLLRRIAHGRSPVRLLDVGASLGAICLAAARLDQVAAAVGIEAAADTVTLAQAIAFVSGERKVTYRRMIAGNDPIAETLGRFDVVTLLSVHHHIANKEAFLADLRATGARWLIAEMPTQDRFYPERGSEVAEVAYIKETLGFAYAEVIGNSPDYHRPLIVFSDAPLDLLTATAGRLMLELGPYFGADLRRLPRRVLAGLARRARKIVTAARPTSPVAGPRRALDWVRNNELPSGGIRVHSAHPRAYPEVSGYLVPTLLAYGELDLAVRIGQWLLTVQREDGAFCDPDHAKPHTFDTGQALRGLLALRGLVDGAEGAARRAAGYLVATSLPGGGWANAYDAEPHVPESIHLYVLPPLFAASRIFAEPAWRDAAERSLAHYLARPGLLDPRVSLTHFLAYEIEALIDLGHHDRVRATLATLERAQRRNGSVRGIGQRPWVCLPGLAQLAICWLKVGQPEPAARALGWLERNQERSGGFRGSRGFRAWYLADVEPAWACKYYLDANLLRVRTFFESEAPGVPAAIATDDGRVTAIAALVTDADTVLEVGCGRGRILAAVAAGRPGARLVGADLAHTLLAHCPAGISRVQTPMELLPFADAQFDVVYSVEAIEHSANPAAAVAEMARITRPGGQVAIIDKHGAAWGRLTTAPWESWPASEELATLLARHCDDVQTAPVAYGDHSAADGLMLAWTGRRR